jgi:two-component system, sensor histidine kinase and response regulator
MFATSVGALVLTCALLIGYQFATSRSELTRELDIVAETVGANTTAALQFGDRQSAREMLEALHADPRTVSGTLFDADGQPFAAWSRSQQPGDVPIPVAVERAVIFDGETLGRIRVVGDLREARARWKAYVGLVLAVMVISAWVALGLSLRLQSVVSTPILGLARVAERVSLERNFSVRATGSGSSEVRLLYRRFNEMLAQIDERERDLKFEIAERSRAQDQLTIAKQSAEAANRAKSAFLANMSHELRTPLNAVIGYSEMLREDAVMAGNEQQASDLAKIEAAARHLHALISNVLDISKIEAGRMTLNEEPFDVATMVADVVATATPLAARNHNHFEVAPLNGLGEMVGDELRIRQVLINLLSNAAKFTENGRIHLSVQRDPTNDGDRVRFAIADTGIGISREQLSRLFGEFVQADASTTRKYGGTGLGLAISRQLSQVMGGEITVQSEPGRGSTFVLIVPAERSSAAMPPPQTPAFRLEEARAQAENGGRSRPPSSVIGHTCAELRPPEVARRAEFQG